MAQIVYAGEPFPSEVNATVYLAGPLPRSHLAHQEPANWHGEMMQALRTAGFTGVVLTPQRRNGEMPPNYDDQKAWELAAMARADVIVFWIVRTEHVLAATTNTELGLFVAQGPQRIVVGIPDDPAISLATGYQRSLVQDYGLRVAGSHSQAAHTVMEVIGGGAWREQTATLIPLCLWRTNFRNYFEHQAKAGIVLQALEVVGAPTNEHQRWAVRGSWHITAEDRYVDRLWTSGALDTVSVVPLHRAGRETSTLLLRQRSAQARNQSGTELRPITAEWEPGRSAVEVAVKALLDQANITVSARRLQPLGGPRQLVDTREVSCAQVFALNLSEEELRTITESGHHHLVATAAGWYEAELEVVSLLSIDKLLARPDLSLATYGKLLLAERLLFG
ncbi:MAG TPA: nucleoside 2-deoxyribosyltransferase domain-containing protein [Verrucomicrobiae bacterium]|nr:nucleoside 2-deoxyribosyltransferase domain-containing protein [Verrucomicrobiae bacterium]